MAFLAQVILVCLMVYLFFASLGYLSPMQYEQRWYEAQRKKAA